MPMTKREQQQSLIARRRRGAHDGRGSGPLPWGYKHAETGGIIIDYIPSVIIQCLFALRDCGKTLQATATGLNEAGYCTQTGKRWTAQLVATIERHRQLYATGQRVWNGVVAQERWPIILRYTDEITWPTESEEALW